MLRVNDTLTIPLDEIEFRFSRSGGPGGQNVNVRDTRVEAIFDLTATTSIGPVRKARALERLAKRLDAQGRLRVVASDERTQGRNRELALERLAAILAEAVKPPPKVRKPRGPSKAAVERRLKAKAHTAVKKRRRARPEVE